MVEPKYNAAEFWEKRLGGGPTLMSVGHSGLGLIYNQWMYKARFRSLEKILQRNHIPVAQKQIVEIGVGSGAYIPFWKKKSAEQITGIDITESSIVALSEKYPELEFVQADIGSADTAISNIYDVATAFDILFHITDDEKFSNAISNLSKMLKSGGIVVMSDSFCAEPWGPFFHEYHRTYEHFVAELEKANLFVVDIEPIFFTMTTVLCTESNSAKRFSRFVTTMHRQIQRIARRKRVEKLNHLIGFALYVVDGLLAKVNRDGPSLKIMVARKNA